MAALIFFLYWSFDCYDADRGGQAVMYGGHEIILLILVLIDLH